MKLAGSLATTALVFVILGLGYWQATDGNPGILLGYFSRGYNSIGLNLRPFMEAGWIVQLHVITALSALGLGTVQLAAPKGTLPHRTLGYAFAILMLTVAITAIFIREINQGNFSFIHVFVPLTLLGLFGMIANARQMKTGKHRDAVMGLFFGALIVPGLFAFMPGRLMWQLFFGG